MAAPFPISFVCLTNLASLYYDGINPGMLRADEMSKRTGFSKLLRKYIISNLCLVLVPVVLLITLMYTAMRQQFLQEIDHMYVNTIERATQILDSDIGKFRAISNAISMDPMLTPHQLNSNDFTVLESMARIRLYALQTDIAKSLMIYQFGDSRFFTDTALMPSS